MEPVDMVLEPVDMAVLVKDMAVVDMELELVDMVLEPVDMAAVVVAEVIMTFSTSTRKDQIFLIYPLLSKISMKNIRM